MLNAVSLAVVSLIALALGGLNVLEFAADVGAGTHARDGHHRGDGLDDGRLLGLILLEGMVLGTMGCVLGTGIGIAFTGLFEAIPAIGRYITFKPTVMGLRAAGGGDGCSARPGRCIRRGGR